MANNFVLDTNLFFNLQSGLNWGKSPKEVIEKFNSFAVPLTATKRAFFYMTPGVVEEMKSFFENEQDYLNVFFVNIIIQSPDYTKVDIGAGVFREFVEETRERAYRGMKIAEEEINNAGKFMLGKSHLSSIDYQKQIGEVIKKFRERFRQATRFNFIDSSTDIDLILLAKEINGSLISADEGVVKWGRLIGVKEIPPSLLASSLETLQ